MVATILIGVACIPALSFAWGFAWEIMDASRWPDHHEVHHYGIGLTSDAEILASRVIRGDA